MFFEKKNIFRLDFFCNIYPELSPTGLRVFTQVLVDKCQDYLQRTFNFHQTWAKAWSLSKGEGFVGDVRVHPELRCWGAEEKVDSSMRPSLSYLSCVWWIFSDAIAKQVKVLIDCGPRPLGFLDQVSYTGNTTEFCDRRLLGWNPLLIRTMSNAKGAFPLWSELLRRLRIKRSVLIRTLSESSISIMKWMIVWSWTITSWSRCRSCFYRFKPTKIIVIFCDDPQQHVQCLIV